MGFSTNWRTDAPADRVMDHDPDRPGRQLPGKVQILRTSEKADTPA